MLLGNHELGLLRILDRLGPVLIQAEPEQEHEPGTGLHLPPRRANPNGTDNANHVGAAAGAEGAVDLNLYGEELSKRLEAKCTSPARQKKALCNGDTRALVKRLKREDVAFLRGLPSYLELPQSHATGGKPVVAVHGGFLPGIRFADQDRGTMASIRNVLPDGTPSLDGGGKYNASVGNGWATLYKGPAHVVFGHDVRADVCILCYRRQQQRASLFTKTYTQTHKHAQSPCRALSMSVCLSVCLARARALSLSPRASIPLYLRASLCLEYADARNLTMTRFICWMQRLGGGFKDTSMLLALTLAAFMVVN